MNWLLEVHSFALLCKNQFPKLHDYLAKLYDEE